MRSTATPEWRTEKSKCAPPARLAGTACATERQGSLLVARVNDERFRERGLRIQGARSGPGRQRIIHRPPNRRICGDTASSCSYRTALAVGVTRVVIRRKVEGGSGRRRLVRRRIRRLDSNVIVRAGRVIRLNGFLTNATGQPIEGATVEALEKQPGGTLTPKGVATTGTDGKFHFTVKATRNRDMLFRYGGSRRVGAATADFTMLVPADTSIRPDRSRLLNGHQVLFTGSVFTRPLPAQGKLVEMQAHFRGRWRTFSTVRANAAGRWRFPYRFGGTVGRITYRFRARLPAEGGYPFIGGNSRVVRVVVHGN